MPPGVLRMILMEVGPRTEPDSIYPNNPGVYDLSGYAQGFLRKAVRVPRSVAPRAFPCSKGANPCWGLNLPVRMMPTNIQTHRNKLPAMGPCVVVSFPCANVNKIPKT